MRVPKVFYLIAAVVVIALLGLAMVRPVPSDVLDVRITRLLRILGDPPGGLEDKSTADLSGIPNLGAETWKAEFQIQVPPESGIWLADRELFVEVPGAHGGWIRVEPKEESLPMPPPRTRIVGMTIWRVLPAGVQRCRLTIGFRRPTVRERGMQILDKTGITLRFPAISKWITRHLPRTEHWMTWRREVQVPSAVLKLESHIDGVAVKPATAPGCHVGQFGCYDVLEHSGSLRTQGDERELPHAKTLRRGGWKNS